MSLASDQVDLYGVVADFICQRLKTEGNSLSDTQYKQLQQQEEKLNELSSDSIIADIQQTLNGLSTSDLRRLADCTKQLKDGVKKIERLDKAFGLISAALGLGIAIYSGNLSGVGAALEQAEKVLTQKSAPASAPTAGLALAAAGDDASQGDSAVEQATGDETQPDGDETQKGSDL